MGKLCRTRQILTTSQVGLPHQEQVVELTLLTAKRIALVFAELVVAQAFESFTLSPGLLKDLLLLVPQILPAQQFPFGILPLLAKRRPAFRGQNRNSAEVVPASNSCDSRSRSCRSCSSR